MRIGVDLLAIQDGTSALRGIGRYVAGLVDALRLQPDAPELVLYAVEHLDGAHLDAVAGRKVCMIAAAPGRVGGAIQGLVDDNPDELDAFIVGAPFCVADGYLPPIAPRSRLRMAGIVYDLIPMLADREAHLSNAEARRDYYERIERLRGYDVLLAISDATRRSLVDQLRIPTRRVVNISAATDETFFVPARPGDPPPPAPPVDGPFIVTVCGSDPHKNLDGLVEAFGLLPPATRRRLKLVLAGNVHPGHRASLEARAAALGAADRVVFTGRIDDRALRELYRQCSAFVFPSLYEGFGLPILEAMGCGAPVVAGDNTSQVEVVADAGLLARVNDAADLAGKLDRVLNDPALAADLRRRGLQRANAFRWSETGRRAVAALVAAKGGVRRGKSVLALAAALPPERTRDAEFAEELAVRLSDHFEVHLYHAGGLQPHLPLRDARFPTFDLNALRCLDQAYRYRQVLYLLGDEAAHASLYAALSRRPGVAVLHAAGPVTPQARAVGVAEADPSAACNLLLRSVVEAAPTILVHAADAADWLRVQYPDAAARIVFVPMPVAVRHAPGRAAARAAVALPQDAPIIGVFGAIRPTKMTAELLQAFSLIAARKPDALLLFVGAERDGGAVRREAAALGLRARVRFRGFVDSTEFRTLMDAVDVAVHLRSPGEIGKASRSLLQLMAAGRPTVVADGGPSCSYPGDALARVAFGPGFVRRLSDRIAGLLDHEPKRVALGERARRCAARSASWATVIERYVALLESAPALRQPHDYCLRRSA